MVNLEQLLSFLLILYVKINHDILKIIQNICVIILKCNSNILNK